ncbi:hypothetical protein [Lacrimispora amygdalina]|uniref:hypothetical protein n=1 Tax=Lacrimispora amygdalina TaxID=253257 RepID=UPI000BE323DF|nr:hypothetical protein [Lacrimispora amygdalina]
MYNTRKDQISQQQIKANIYDYTELIIDIGGMTEDIINRYIDNEFTQLFPPGIYKRAKTELYESEIDDYEDRSSYVMSITSKKRLLETETVLRYSAKDGMEQIIISTMFVIIKLDYKCTHKLNEKINLISEIMNCLIQNAYTEINRITINKRDRIICATLFRLYQCFNKNIFGDIAYALSRKNKNTNGFYLRSDSLFNFDEYDVHVSREVKRGEYEDTQAFQGSLKMNVRLEGFEIEDDTQETIQRIKKSFVDLNDICYKIFIEHITLSFAADLVVGTTDKVLGGFNKNE